MNILATMKQALESLALAKTSNPLEWANAPIDECVNNLRAAIKEVEEAEPLGFVETLVDDHVIKIMKLDVNMPLFTYPPDAQAEIERLRQVCRNVYEVWAGSEGIPIPETAPEAYLLYLLEKMRDEVKEGME